MPDPNRRNQPHDRQSPTGAKPSWTYLSMPLEYLQNGTVDSEVGAGTGPREMSDVYFRYG